MEKEKYFNFPVPLLKGFLNNPNKIINNIIDFGLYKQAQSYGGGKQRDNIQKAADYLGITLGNVSESIRIGSDLYWNYKGESVPMTGISKSLLFSFRDNEKTEFDLVCLLAFLSIKSIIGNKGFIRITNKFWLSRMAGNIKSVKCNDELPKELQCYSNRYWTTKIKFELIENWGLISYSRGNRGFFISLSLSLDELAFQAEISKKKYKKNNHKEAQKQSYLNALEKLKNINKQH